jgi:glycerate kinase
MAMTFLHAIPQSGIELLLDLLQFAEKLQGADLVITGEGRFDSQSLRGKAPLGILKIASDLSVPVALICGQITLNDSNEIIQKFHSISSLDSIEPDIQICISEPGPIIEKIATSIAKGLTS